MALAKIKIYYPYFSMSVAVVERIVDVVAAAEPQPKFIMEDVRPPVTFVEIKPSLPRQVDDDWFVLLDVAAKVPGMCGYNCEAESDNRQ